MAEQMARKSIRQSEKVSAHRSRRLRWARNELEFELSDAISGSQSADQN